MCYDKKIKICIIGIIATFLFLTCKPIDDRKEVIHYAQTKTKDEQKLKPKTIP